MQYKNKEMRGEKKLVRIKWNAKKVMKKYTESSTLWRRSANENIINATKSLNKVWLENKEKMWEANNRRKKYERKINVQTEKKNRTRRKQSRTYDAFTAYVHTYIDGKKHTHTKPYIKKLEYEKMKSVE